MCEHRNTVFQMAGSVRLVEGEVEDDVHEEELCVECGALVWRSDVPDPEDMPSEECPF
jgi:hypothetical protein